MIQKMGYGFELKTIRMITKGTTNLKTKEIRDRDYRGHLCRVGWHYTHLGMEL
jgi:hypothetical protein